MGARGTLTPTSATALSSPTAEVGLTAANHLLLRQVERQKNIPRGIPARRFSALETTRLRSGASLEIARASSRFRRRRGASGGLESPFVLSGRKPGNGAVGGATARAGTPLRLPALVVRHPQRLPLGGLPSVWRSWEPRSRFLSMEKTESSSG